MSAGCANQFPPLIRGGATVAHNGCTGQAPTFAPICSSALGATVLLPGGCVFGGYTANIDQYCSYLGGSGEWTGSLQAGPACLTSGKPPYYDFKCIGNECPVSFCCSGTAPVCQRAQFNGNPIQCCLNDYVCRGRAESTDALCFTPIDAQGQTSLNAIGNPNTCAPGYRDVAGPSCNQVLLGYCTGADLNPNNPAWIDRWMQPDGSPVPDSCLYALQRSLFSVGGATGVCSTGPLVDAVQPCGSLFGPSIPGATGGAQASSAGVAWGSALMQAVAAKYQAQGFSFGALPGNPGYGPFQDFVYGYVCCPYPAVCQGMLQGVCRSYSADRLSLSPAAAKFCGCHLPAAEYNTYEAQFQINVPCTPTCVYPGTVPITDANGRGYPCTQNVCLIDDITVNLVQSRVGQGIDISQICSNCSSAVAGAVANCGCIIKGDSLDLINSSVSGNVSVSTSCAQATCVGASGTGPCNSVGAGATGPSTASAFRTKVVIGVTAIAVALGLIVLLYHATGFGRRGRAVGSRG